MTHSVSQAPPEVAFHHHLLGLSRRSGRAHRRPMGPLAVSLGHGTSWQRALAASLEASGLAGRGGGRLPRLDQVGASRAPAAMAARSW